MDGVYKVVGMNGLSLVDASIIPLRTLPSHGVCAGRESCGQHLGNV